MKHLTIVPHMDIDFAFYKFSQMSSYIYNPLCNRGSMSPAIPTICTATRVFHAHILDHGIIATYINNTTKVLNSITKLYVIGHKICNTRTTLMEGDFCGTT